MIATKHLLTGCAVLAAALSFSVYKNVAQWADARAAEERFTSEINALRAAGRIQGLEISSRQSQAVADAATAKHDELIKTFEIIARDQEKMTANYWRRIQAVAPLSANCAPGQGRVDVFNDRSDHD